MSAELEPRELSRIRRAFTNGLWILGMVDVYWYMASRRIVMRKVQAPHPEKQSELPRAAQFIGRYAYPCDAADFLDDLTYLIGTWRNPLSK